MQNCKNILIKNGKDNYFLFYSSEIGTLAMCKFIYSESMLFESLVHANTNSQYMIDLYPIFKDTTIATLCIRNYQHKIDQVVYESHLRNMANWRHRSNLRPCCLFPTFFCCRVPTIFLYSDKGMKYKLSVQDTSPTSLFTIHHMLPLHLHKRTLYLHWI